MSKEDGNGRSGDSTKNDRIFLQICEDDDSEWLGEVTWCQDRVNPEDVEYIRADLVEQKLTAKDALLQQAYDAIETIDKVAKESKTIISVAGQAMRILGKVRTVMAAIDKELGDVERAVDVEMDYREQLAEVKNALGDYYFTGLPLAYSVVELVKAYKDRNGSAATFMEQLNETEKQLATEKHISNEWADAATTGLQWIKNINDGICTPQYALENMMKIIRHCKELSDTQSTRS